MTRKYLIEAYRPILDIAILEDIGSGDITTESIFPGEGQYIEARIISKEKGIVCGLDLVDYTFSQSGGLKEVRYFAKDGDEVSINDVVMTMVIEERKLLSYERIALNVLQHLSGIATKTKEYVRHLENTKISILDTRKTIPGYRLLEKYAVQVGGGKNHRMGLYDLYLIKDNHISACGGIREAVKRVKKHRKKEILIEIECKNLEEVKEAVNMGVDIIMLDNMHDKQIKEVIEHIPSPIRIEVSGNITTGKLATLSNLKIDYISSGAITHSARAMDYSMIVSRDDYKK